MTQKENVVPKKFAVVGAGPVGCIVAAFLASGGYRVALCDVVSDFVEAAKDPGIHITGAETLHQKITETRTDIEKLSDFDPDVIIIAVKANALPLIASVIKGFIRENMYVVSWQNGIDTELELAETLGRERVLRAVVNYGCVMNRPGEVVMGFHHPPHYIQELDESASKAAVKIAQTLSECGLATEQTDSIVSMVWRKSAMNASMNPVCALTRMTMAQAINDPIVFSTVNSLFKECLKVARANEIFLGWDFFPQAMAYLKNAGNHKPSMLMDVENQRRTEINFINGKFVDYGQQAGIETPYNDTMLALIKGLEKT